MNIQELHKKLETRFPEYEFGIGKRIYGQCIIAKKSKYSGADIFIKNDKILLEAGIPEMKTRLLLGSGALLLKMFKKDYNEPCLKIFNYLTSENISVKVRK